MFCSTTPEPGRSGADARFWALLARHYAQAFWIGALLWWTAAGRAPLRHGAWLAHELVAARLAPIFGPSTARLLDTELGAAAIGATLVAWVSLPGAAWVAWSSVRRRRAVGAGARSAVVLAAFVMIHGVLWLRSASALGAGAVALAAAALGGLTWAGALVAAAALAAALGRLPRPASIPGGAIRRRGALAGALAVPPALLLLGAIDAARTVPSPLPDALRGSEPVVLIGLDGVGWEWLRGIEAAGAAPALRAMHESEGGLAAPLRSIHPALSPPVWTSIATGKRPWQHGIDRFVFEGESAVPAHAGHRRVRPLWEIAGDLGLRCLVVNWYVSWPAAAPAGSIVVSDRFLREGLEARVAPAARRAEVDSVVAAHRFRADSLHVAIAGPEPDPLRAPVAHGAWRHLGREIERDWLATRVLLHFLEDRRWDLVLLYLRGTDGAQHRYWREHVAAHGPRTARWAFAVTGAGADPGPYGDVVLRYYRQVDAWLAEIRARLAEGSRLLVASDHGVGVRLGDPGRAQLDPLFERLGWLVRDAEGEIDSARSMLWDATPPRRGDRRDRRVELGAGGWTIAEAAARLRALETTDGVALFAKVERDGSALRLALQRALSGGSAVALPLGGEMPLKRFAAVSIEGDFTGSHRMDGILLGSFGDPAAAEGRGYSVLDITPTVLELLDLPCALDMEGAPIEALLDAPVSAPVASWERRVRRLRIPDHTGDEEIRRELRSLGYID